MSKFRQCLSSFNGRIYKVLVWLLRIAVGATFIFAGFTKAVDPWGFVIKIEEYLQVWGIDWLWRETVLCTAVAISTVEFLTGFALVTGCLRRSTTFVAMLFMVVMLPLTAYIALVSPVSDCGCFGDALVISNTATFLKNVVLTLAIIYLLRYNRKVGSLYPPLMQWMPMVVSLFFCLVVSFIGIVIQPLVDFRPYKVGTSLLSDTDHGVGLVYERDGIEREFSVDALPDSTWTYVRRAQRPVSAPSALAIYDGDDDVTDMALESDGPQMILVVPDVERHAKARASMANNVNDYITSHGGAMIGLIGTDAGGLQRWVKAAKPNFDVYTADDTSLKELVRGDAGLVYLYNDTIRWKRNIFSLSGDFPDFSSDDEMDHVTVIDSGAPIMYISAFYMALLVVLYLLGLIRIKNDKGQSHKKC